MKERDPLDLGQYVNDADIWASDTPAVVIQKLQAAINRAKADPIEQLIETSQNLGLYDK
jgi:hypothetical protein